MQQRYETLVLQHLAPLQEVAAGIRALPDAGDAFAATQAAWRFFRNEKTTLPQLIQPLLDHACQVAPLALQDFALVVHDWSQLHYKNHTRKQDRVDLTNQHDPGYELFTALLLGDQQGQPIAPLFQSLRAAEGLHRSDAAKPVPLRPTSKKLDRLAPVFDFLERQPLGKPLVHIIDREADSVEHYRKGDRRGRYFLIRADDIRLVLYQGRECLLPEVVADLRARQVLAQSREVDYHGASAQQFVAEADVTLHRPAKQHQGRVSKRGRALRLRLVVSEVRDADGQVLAVWLLLTNLPPQVSAATVALWYYWRWRIESFFKLLKSAGLHLEQWQQRQASVVAKRLLVASMACALVWQVRRSEAAGAPRLREVLIRLSGRQMKTGVESTDPALLAGLWVLLQTLAVLDHYDPQELRELLQTALQPPDSPPPKPDV